MTMKKFLCSFVFLWAFSLSGKAQTVGFTYLKDSVTTFPTNADYSEMLLSYKFNGGIVPSLGDSVMAYISYNNGLLQVTKHLYLSEGESSGLMFAKISGVDNFDGFLYADGIFKYRLPIHISKLNTLCEIKLKYFRALNNQVLYTSSKYYNSCIR